MPYIDSSQRSFVPSELAGAGLAVVPSHPWAVTPYTDLPHFDETAVRTQWERLHAGQGRPPPPEGTLAQGWVRYHCGDFEGAAAVGLQHGTAGLALTNQATAIYANYLESRDSVRLALLRQVAERAAQRLHAAPDDSDAHYWYAYALGRYSQGISVARALAQGLGSQVKDALERVISLRPAHADAHIALGAFHAEVIDKVGPLVGRMTYGVRADAARDLFERALALNPHSASALMEHARALVMLEGETAMAEATRLYEQAAALRPADARERLDQELARAGLHD
ncbi:tetratricopeptide repeat protein [Variovorax ginsengisoli]|uniref:Tetratricopeptide (TPR) repeat protein n=1 Tax=Variovorax ginsengisoli TaxID=363844 RepID=A0ABT9SCI9_9BURK|nr:hypothetical protein [Variovorax ginsengisoli]MDP9902065.1 tetratricopeptide (TPR) repeat protein [Variovorax ginsengisoli]